MAETLDPHVEAVAAAKPGRRFLVAHPIKASCARKGWVVRFGTPGRIISAATDHIKAEVRRGGGYFMLRIERAEFAHIELEPAR